MKCVYFIKCRLIEEHSSLVYYDYNMINHVDFDINDIKVAAFRFANKWSRDCWYLKHLDAYEIVDEWIDKVNL